MTTLTAQQVTVTIDHKILCDGLTTNIAPGQFWGILGCNGSGKTTLLHTLAGLYPTTSGELLLDEKRLNDHSHKELAQRIAVLLQDNQTIFPSTVWESVLSARFAYLNEWQRESEADKQLVNTILQQLKLDALQNRTLQQLSGGERQRVALACTLAQTPQLYLLDEPTNHLDIHYQVLVLQHLQQLVTAQKKSIVMVSQDINHVSHFCSHVILLFDNKDYLLGPTAELLTTDTLSALYQQAIESTQTENGPLFHPRLG